MIHVDRPLTTTPGRKKKTYDPAYADVDFPPMRRLRNEGYGVDGHFCRSGMR
jgi:hypothetical protein